MSLQYTVRPLSDRTWLKPSARVGTRFQAKWGATQELLERELDHLRARDLVIGIDVTEGDLRLDGRLRANARPSSPGVELAFDSKHGPLIYRCDKFVAQYYSQGEDWQHNARAIALTLEALRAVDRYAASSSGEQYRGYRQIASTAADTPLAAAEAWKALSNLAGVSVTEVTADRLIGLARRNAHPDTGGSREKWALFDRAYRVVRP